MFKSECPGKKLLSIYITKTVKSFKCLVNIKNKISLLNNFVSRYIFLIIIPENCAMAVIHFLFVKSFEVKILHI